MKEPVIVQTSIKDRIQLENKFNFNATTTVGLAEGGDFFLILNFLDLTEDDLKNLMQLSKQPNRLSIKSDLINKEKYNITHVVVTKFSANNNLEMTWECLSDDPSMYDSFITK